jgi:hypothetical protein
MSREFPWMYGTLLPTAEAAAFQELFRWMVAEENVSTNPPFDEALLDEENWFIEQEDGEKVGISLPAVHAEGEIGWQWR